MPITHFKLRQLFRDFWEKRDHKEVPPISLVPKDDPTTLFTGSGMQQLVPYLLGEPHPLGKRLYNIQRCFRSQDIEEVGDNRHTTFFEMMGNWSLDDYFKEEQLEWCWKFFTEELNLPKEKLYVSVFEGSKEVPRDEETAKIWKKLGVPEERIFHYGVDKNWWSRAGAPEDMPQGEPGGPDSEIFFEFDGVLHDPKFGNKCHPNCQCGRFMEIGNSVFIEYVKQKNGSFKELPTKNVDFGGGLERIMAVLNNNPDIFTTDLYLPIIKSVEEIAQKTYSDLDYAIRMRVIADHLKAAVFMAKENLIPSNKQQGYVMRRLIRRVVVKMMQLQIIPLKATPIICQKIIDTYKNIYFGQSDSINISAIIGSEINTFLKTLDKGLKVIQKIEKIDGKIAFDLYQSYGFPLEITEELFREKGQLIDKKQFYAEFGKHKNLSRTASIAQFKGGLADQSQQTIRYHTATHLFHQALFDVLGNDIRQEGSNITVERLRFDFYSTQKPTDEEIKKVELVINQKISEALPVKFKIMPKKEAEKVGAKAFFREKYPDLIKVYFIGNYSKEFCGGPHVKNTKEIGKITIYKFEKIGSNLYRVYAK